MDWQLVGLIVTIVIAALTCFGAIVKWLVDGLKLSYESLLNAQATKIEELSKSMAELRVDLQQQFVRKEECRSCREDGLKNLMAIENKLDHHREIIFNKLDEFRRDLFLEFRQIRTLTEGKEKAS